MSLASNCVYISNFYSQHLAGADPVRKLNQASSGSLKLVAWGCPPEAIGCLANELCIKM